MKTTISLSGDVEKDIQRLDKIKAEISKGRLDSNQQQIKSLQQNRDNFIKKLFTSKESPIEVRKKKLIKYLGSEKFKKQFYSLQKLKTPLTWYQKLENFIRTIIHNIDERFRKKSHIELLMDRISLMDEMNLLEKRVKMAKYGIDPMLERDLEENDKRELQNQTEELLNYRKELGEFLSDDPEYIKLRDDEKKMYEDTEKAMQAHRAIWDTMEVEKKPGETDPRYSTFSSTSFNELPNDLETPQ